MKNKIGFAIPGLYENFQVNKILIELKQNRSECFYEDINIDAVYGNFQFCIWDGGRIFPAYYHATLEDIQDIQYFYNIQNNIPMRFIYTNTQIKEEHLYDRFCNLITKLCENDLNEIVVNSPILEEYLRTNYPKYKFISSTTKCLRNKDDANQELNKEYYRVCLDYNLNYNLDFLKTLTDKQKEKTEFLVNPICGANCQNRKKHYDLNSFYSLNYGKYFNLDFCNILGDTLYPFEKHQRNELLLNDILTTYKNLGFYNYKIEGRSFSPLQHLCVCSKYLIKPEYQLFFINTVFEKFKEIENNDQNY